MTQPAQDTLKAYIARVTEIRAERDNKLGPDELRAIALDLGLTTAELDGIEKAAADHAKRARGFLANALWDDAIAELVRALALGPTDGTLHLDLARAHIGRFGAAKDPADLRVADGEVRRALAIDPELADGYGLLKQVASLTRARPAVPARAPVEKPVPSEKRRHRGWLVLPALALAWGAIEHRAPAGPHEWQQAVHEAPAQAGSIGVITGPRSAGFQVATRVSEVRNQSGASSYYFEGLVVNRGTREISDLAVELKLLNDDNHVVHDERIRVVDPTNSAPMRPGDERVVTLARGIEAPVTQALFSPLVNQSRLAPAYPPSKAVTPIWNFSCPAGVRLDLRERQLTVARLAHGNFLSLTLEATNRGVGALKGLSYNTAFYDAHNHLLASPHHDLIPVPEPALMPNETREALVMEPVPANYDHYQLQIYYAQ